MKQSIRKTFIIFLFSSMLLASSGCQEITISVEYNSDESRKEGTQTAMDSAAQATASPSLKPTRTPFLPTQESISETENDSFDPEKYFFPEEMLPEGMSFNSSDNLTYYASYLFSPGSLFGVAHVKLYEASIYSISIEEVIIESTIPVSPQNLKVGHNHEELKPDTSEQALGDYAMTMTSMTHNAITYHYHFYKDNIIVLLSLGGMDPYVSKENVYQLAKAIEDRLPEQYAVIDGIDAPSLELQPGLIDNYFKELELMSCNNPELSLDAIPIRAYGFCYYADTTKLIRSFKTGIYSDEYHEVIFIKDFNSPPQLGKQYAELFSSEWDFAWHELQAGDYQALFWVDDQLVKAIPFTIAGNTD